MTSEAVAITATWTKARTQLSERLAKMPVRAMWNPQPTALARVRLSPGVQPPKGTPGVCTSRNRPPMATMAPRPWESRSRWPRSTLAMGVNRT